jgi:hypothetical protein
MNKSSQSESDPDWIVFAWFFEVWLVFPSGPMIERTTGKNINPCKRPSSTTVTSDMTKTMRMSLDVKISGIIARKVLTPPSSTDAPVDSRTSLAFSFLVVLQLSWNLSVTCMT